MWFDGKSVGERAMANYNKKRQQMIDDGIITIIPPERLERLAARAEAQRKELRRQRRREKQEEKEEEQREEEERMLAQFNFPQERTHQPKEKLRPKDLEHFIGQEDAKKAIRILVDSSNITDHPIKHLLLEGPAGTGKTTLSLIIAGMKENARLHQYIGEGLEKPVQITEMLGRIEPNDIIFIDEIHNIKSENAEFLYRPLEEGCGNLPLPNRSVKFFHIHPFTLIGATTDAGKLLKPFKDRLFPIHIQRYTSEDMVKIIRQSAGLLNLDLDDDLVRNIARRTKWIPRIANRLLEFLESFCLANEYNRIDKDVVEKAMEAMAVDKIGLNRLDREYLIALYASKSHTAGLRTLQSNLQRDPELIERDIESYLIDRETGLVVKTEKGRVLTEKGIKYVEEKLISEGRK